MNVRDAMAKTISTASPTDTIQHVARLMKAKDTGFIPIVDNGDLVGVVTDRDIVIGCVAEGHDGLVNETVSHVMTPHVESVSPDDDLEDAAKHMADREVRRLAVCEDGKLVGILSHGNLVQATSAGGPAKTATEAVTRGA